MNKIKNIIKQNKILENIFRTPYELFKKSKALILTIWVKKIGISNGKKRIKLLSNKESNDLIKKMLNSKKPFMIARYGGTEFSVMLKLGNQEYEDYNLNMVAGVFPKDKKTINKFRETYLEASKHIDVLAVWLYRYYFREKVKLIKRFQNIKNFIHLDDISPHKNSWIKSLKGKKVLIIHPFEKSIKHQYKKRMDIEIIPEFKKLEVLKAVQSAGGEGAKFKDWYEALEYMKKEISKKDFDVALIGCGAYGFPLAAHVKKIGKQAIHVGGSLQLLFGIKGKRWEESEGIKFPRNWIYPLPEDTPKNIKKIEKAEGGCYW